MNVKDIKNMDKEHILELLGLKEDSTLGSVFGALGWIGVGALAGAVVALLLAPKTGRELRETVGRKIKQRGEEVVGTARAKIDDVAERGGV